MGSTVRFLLPPCVDAADSVEGLIQHGMIAFLGERLIETTSDRKSCSHDKGRYFFGDRN